MKQKQTGPKLNLTECFDAVFLSETLFTITILT